MHTSVHGLILLSALDTRQHIWILIVGEESFFSFIAETLDP